MKTTDTEDTEKTVKTTGTNTADAEQFSGSDYAELEGYLRKRMEETKGETDKDRRKRERREKWEGIISGIGDMGRALGNLYYASRGAPGMYDGKDSLSDRAKERFEKAKAEREKKRDEWMNYALTLGKLRDSARDFKLREKQAAAEQEYRKGQAEYQNKSLELRQREEDRRQTAASIALRKQEWLEKYQQGVLDIKKEQLEIERQYKEGLISKMERDAACNELRVQAAWLTAKTGSQPVTTETTTSYDNRGRETGTTTTKTPGGKSYSNTKTPGSKSYSHVKDLGY